MHHITLAPYAVEVYLLTTRREWKNLRRTLTWLESGPHVDSLGSCHFDVDFPEDALPVPHVILWLDMKRINNTPDLVETCAHEASHAMSQILEYIGHDHDGTDEPSAYLAGWLTRWMYEAAI